MKLNGAEILIECLIETKSGGLDVHAYTHSMRGDADMHFETSYEQYHKKYLLP